MFLGIPVTIGKTVDALASGNPARIAQVPTFLVWMAGFAIGTAITRIYSRTVIFNAARSAEYDLRDAIGDARVAAAHQQPVEPGRAVPGRPRGAARPGRRRVAARARLDLVA